MINSMCKYTDESIQSQGKKNNKNYIKKNEKKLALLEMYVIIKL